nr:MAG TPA: hypothetical protein [Caudoviricetes sp.]
MIKFILHFEFSPPIFCIKKRPCFHSPWYKNEYCVFPTTVVE